MQRFFKFYLSSYFIFNKNKNMISKLKNPITQAIVTFSIGIVLMLILWGISANGSSVSPRSFWLSSAFSLLLYAFFSAVSSASAKNIFKYWAVAIILFLVMMFSFSGLATYLSQMYITEAKSYWRIYATVGIAYGIFLVIAFLMKNVLGIMRTKVERREYENKENILK